MSYSADCTAQNYLFYVQETPNRLIWSIEKKLNSDPMITRADNTVGLLTSIYAVAAKHLHTLVKQMYAMAVLSSNDYYSSHFFCVAWPLNFLWVLMIPIGKV